MIDASCRARHPASRNTTDFVRAPERLNGFLEDRALATFMGPSGWAFRAAGVLFGAIRRITGVGLVDDLTTSFGLLGGLLKASAPTRLGASAARAERAVDIVGRTLCQGGSHIGALIGKADRDFAIHVDLRA